MNQQKIGVFLKELRVEKGLTQEKLAEYLGVSNRSVSRWENGNNMPDLDLLIELSKFYGVGINEILDGKRKETHMDEQTTETLEKVAEYTNEEKMRLTKRLHICLYITLALSFAAFTIEFLEIDGAVAGFINGLSSGITFGMTILALILTSRRGAKLREVKLRLLRRIIPSKDEN